MGNNEKSKILVVDDERSNIDALGHILKPTYTMLVAKDGHTAVELARSKKPDLILLDIIMPGMNGFETLIELKGADSTRQIPVIFITGVNGTKEEHKGLSLGAVDYITKPFSNSIVAARVRNHIQMSKYIRMIEHLCMIDTLTNIPNRRYFDKQTAIEWEQAIKDKKPVSLLMIDIDKFKNYNDTYGHQQGDSLLKTIVTFFKQELKHPDYFTARWGGEEFVVLLPGIDLYEALEMAEQIRKNIEHAVFPCMDGTGTKITVSIGVNTEFPAKGSIIDDFILGADKALYIAKENGRNKIIHTTVNYPVQV